MVSRFVRSTATARCAAVLLVTLAMGACAAPVPLDAPAGSACAGGKCDEPTATDCTDPGQVLCGDGALYTCESGDDGSLRPVRGETCTTGVCADRSACTDCEDECDAWGASCQADELHTCVVGPDGCLDRMVHRCRVGCSDGACDSCPAVEDPWLGSVAEGAGGFHDAVDAQDGIVLSAWRAWDGRVSRNEWGLGTFDVSDPARMTSLARQHTLADARFGRTAWVGDRYYALQSGSVLRIFDVSDPIAPIEVGAYDGDGYTIRVHDLSVDGDLACLAADDGVHVLAVDGAVPELLSITSRVIAPQRVVCRNGLAAVAGAHRIQLVDLSDPSAPRRIAEASFSGVGQQRAHDIAFDGETIWWAGDGVLHAFQLDDERDALQRVGTLRDVPSTELELHGNRLYFVGGRTVGSVDVSVVEAPRMEKRVIARPRGSSIAFDGDTLFMGGDGVHAFDLSAASDVHVRALGTRDWLYGADLVGSFGALATHEGVLLLDVRDPTAPVELGRIEASPRGVALVGHVALVLHTEGLAAYDVSRPAAPVLLHDERRGQPKGGFHVVGDRAYARCRGGGGLCLYDVSDPAQPHRIDSTTAARHATGWAYNQDAYAVDDQQRLYLPTADGLRVFDFSDPAELRLLGEVPLEGQHGDMELVVEDGIAYHARPCYGSGHLCVHSIDVRNPSAPRALDQLPVSLGEGLQSVELARLRVDNGTLYAGHRRRSIVAIDVNHPERMRVQSELWTDHEPAELFFFDGTLTALTVDRPRYGAASSDRAYEVVRLCR